MSSQSYIFNPTERTSAAAGDGFSAPRLTTTDRMALSLGVNGKGMMVYDTTLLALYIWNGTAWITLPAAGYTQGTWSPTFSPVTGTITLDPANSTGLWSRIGNTVTVVGHFAVQSVSSPTGLLSITNLPFAPVVGFESAASITGFGFSAGAITSIVATISGTAVQAYHYQAGALNALSVHVIAATNIYISGTYITT
jgi:hypothetical protein